MEIIRARKTKLSIDLAPLIDVVFQLLVFFMLTSTFAKPAMELNLPKAVMAEKVQDTRIVIEVNRDGQISVNQELTSKEELVTSLRKLFKQENITTVDIEGDQNIVYGSFMEVMNLSKQAGATQINLVHEKDAQ
ncbi:MAG: biopolymer transport protein ExbD [Lysobacterales bacterium]|jgi:biopolymer transport protein ExbD